MSLGPARAGALLLALVLVLVGSVAQAHEFRPGLLRLIERPAAGGGASGSFDLVLISPPLSASGPIPEGALRPIVPEHCRIDGTVLACGEAGLVGGLGVEGLDRHPIDVLVEVTYVDGTRLTAVLGPDEASTTIHAGAAQRRGSVFVEYLRLGVEHILIGLDHLLFVLGLVLLVREGLVERPRSTAAALPSREGAALLWTVTAFTLAHSITLAASTLELVRLPSPPVEAGIALSILLLARELALGLDAGSPRDTLSWRRPHVVAFAFGLLHGFGFAGALREVGLPPDQVPAALLAFNLGVELGQLAVVAVLLLLFAGARATARRLAIRPNVPSREGPAKRGRDLEGLARRVPIWAMGGLACAWTLERVLGFWP